MGSTEELIKVNKQTWGWELKGRVAPGWSKQRDEMGKVRRAVDILEQLHKLLFQLGQ